MVLRSAVLAVADASTVLRYTLAAEGEVRLGIYGVDGRLVRELVGSRQRAGWHEVVWDGRDGQGREVATGMYLARLEVGSTLRTNKLMLLR